MSVPVVAAYGPGSMSAFSVNGRVRFEKLSWKHSMVVHPYFGVYCDARKRCAYAPGDRFSWRALRCERRVDGVSVEEARLTAGDADYRP